MNDLIVIGAGFWGRAIYDHATAGGIDALLIDALDPLAASRNAAGIVSLNWYTSETVTPMLPAYMSKPAIYKAIDWLQMNWGLRHTPEHFQGPVHYRVKKDSFLLPHTEFERTRPMTFDRVQSVQRGPNHWRVITDQQEYTAKRLVIACGAKTDDLLQRSRYPALGLKALRGRAVVYGEGDGKLPELYTEEVTKYKHLTVRSWGNQWRVGDTVEEKPRENALDRLHTWAGNIHLSSPVKTLEGYRPVLKQMTVRHFDEGGVVATGGHRVGLALSPIAALQSLKLLGLL